MEKVGKEEGEKRKLKRILLHSFRAKRNNERRKETTTLTTNINRRYSPPSSSLLNFECERDPDAGIRLADREYVFHHVLVTRREISCMLPSSLYIANRRRVRCWLRETASDSIIDNNPREQGFCFPFR